MVPETWRVYVCLLAVAAGVKGMTNAHRFPQSGCCLLDSFEKSSECEKAFEKPNDE